MFFILNNLNYVNYYRRQDIEIVFILQYYKIFQKIVWEVKIL